MLPSDCTDCGYVNALLQDLETRLRHELEDQRRTEQALVRSRDALQAFMDAVGEAALLLAADGVLLAINRVAAERLQTSPDAIVGQSVYALLPEPLATERRLHVEEVVRSHRNIRFVDERDGRQIEHTLYPVLGSDGAVAQVAVIGTDVSRHLALQQSVERARRRLQTLIGNLPGIAYRCRNDRDWTMEFISEGCRELTGYTADELVESRVRSFVELIHPDDRDRVW